MPEIITCGCGTSPTIIADPELRIAAAATRRTTSEGASALRAYYPLGDHGTDDASGNGADLLPMGTEPDTTLGMACLLASLLDGSQWWESPVWLGRELTVSAWIRPTRSRRETTLLSIGENLRFGLSWYLEPVVWINERMVDETIIAAPPIQADRWCYVAFVRDRNEYRIVIDGIAAPLTMQGTAVPQAIASVDPRITENDVVLISRYRDGSGLHGAIQDIVIRANAITTNEIQAEYRSYCETLTVVIAE